MSTIVAIVGRPNVGKSTFFNRLIENRQAIVDKTSGVTRDRHYGQAEWNGKTFTVIDTGGYVIGGEDHYGDQIDLQVKTAVEEADMILFLVNCKDGVTPDDEAVAELVRRSSKPTFLVVNKVDNPDDRLEATTFYQLGFEQYYELAAISGSGTGDLLDDISERIIPEEENIEEIPKLAVVGRPNAGKSSFINAILGKERFIVNDESGTTRDANLTRFNRFGHAFDLIDTAGIRKKSRVREDLEFYSVLRSIRSIENADVSLILFDAQRGFDHQVQKIFWLAEKNNNGIVIVVNKWDLIEKDHRSVKEYTAHIKEEIAPFTDVPILFISVKDRKRVLKALDIAHQVVINKNKRIKTRKLNDVLLPLIQKNPPPAIKGKYVKIKYITQLPTKRPQFAFFCNLPQYVKEPYRRYLENLLREAFDFTGVPISVYMRKK